MSTHNRAAEPEKMLAQISNEITFRALAIEILAGRVARHAGGNFRQDAYEVFAFEGDCLSTVIVRSFDHGTAFAFAAATTHEGLESPFFTNTAQRLLETRAELPLSRAARL